VLAALAAEGITRVDDVPLAQHSEPVYADAVRAPAKEVPAIDEVRAARNWGREPLLTEAFANAVVASLEGSGSAPGPTVVFTAHSLPQSVIDAGDPYAAEVAKSAEDVITAVRAKTGALVPSRVAFQSQGLGGGSWLGPDLRATLEALAVQKQTTVVIAPIGFLADHVEILYDLDIEAKGWAEELGIDLRRTASLNDDDALVAALAVVAKRVMSGGE
jgi:ferrochelatase